MTQTSKKDDFTSMAAVLVAIKKFASIQASKKEEFALIAAKKEEFLSASRPLIKQAMDEQARNRKQLKGASF